jgi:PAS domain S-box-containing protein
MAVLYHHWHQAATWLSVRGHSRLARPALLYAFSRAILRQTGGSSTGFSGITNAGGDSLSKRTRSAELAALTSIAAQVNCTQDLGEILAGALGTTLEVIGEESGEIFLVDEETGDLLLHTHQGLSEAFVAAESVIGHGECICGQAVQSGRIGMITDMATHPARSREACMREGFRSCIRLPLLARGEVLGLLNIQSRATRLFTAEDEELLTAIGNQIGIAIANAQLIDDAEHRRATLDSVMNSLVDGLILVDKRGRIAYMNPRAEGLLGLTSSALVGHAADAIDREIQERLAQPETVLAQLRSATADPQSMPAVEFTVTVDDARTLQARFFSIQGVGGGSLGLGLLLRDITREKELDQMKSQLLSTVSHELRTPLASIKGFATTLLRQDVEWDEGSRREFLSIINDESDRLTELISNLLDMSRIEAGTLRIEIEPIDLPPIIEETATEFQMMTRDHMIQTHLPPVLPPVMADPRRARQVLRNLVENAVKYSPNGGPITISAQVQADHVQASIADQGIGIERKQLDHIFDRFYQVDSASTRRVGGSGLGLSICKAIIEAHSGQIWVESQPNLGSTFHFTLPLARPADESAKE